LWVEHWVVVTEVAKRVLSWVTTTKPEPQIVTLGKAKPERINAMQERTLSLDAWRETRN
jgi:hypothetical protein